LNAPFARRHGSPVQVLALIFSDTLGIAAILLGRTNLVMKKVTLRTRPLPPLNEATELITVFPESVDSPQRSFDESILRALRKAVLPMKETKSFGLQIV
jgi:hypothetical protein